MLNDFINFEKSLNNYDAAHIYKLTDLTLLNEDATDEQILQKINEAIQKNTAAICLYPDRFKLLTNTININIKKATVVNFPQGNKTTEEVIANIKEAIEVYNIDEVDYVFPYQYYLKNEKNLALKSCETIIKTCQKYNKNIKIIIESGSFTTNIEIYNLCLKLIEFGCDFIKTSTGKISNGATIDAAFTILKAIKDTNSNCGIKVSGGVRTFQQANTYIKLAEYVLNKEATANWFRIGASNLTNNFKIPT